MIGYVEASELEAWALARGITLKKSPDILLTLALDWMEVQQYAGIKTDAAQPLQWPRKGVCIDGVLVDSAVIPDEVSELQIRVAADIDDGMNPSGQRKAVKSSATVFGAVAVTYAVGSSDSPLSTQAMALLRKLRGGMGGLNQIEVSRG